MYDLNFEFFQDIDRVIKPSVIFVQLNNEHDRRIKEYGPP